MSIGPVASRQPEPTGRPDTSIDPQPAGTLEGAFSPHGPWTLREGDLTWRPAVAGLRRATAQQLPRLLRRRTLPPLGRSVVTVVRLGWAVLAWTLVERRQDRARSRAGLSRRLRKAFERLGPTYIKLGQILSSGEGLFPEELVAEFRLLRDHVPPEPFNAVRRVLEEDLGRPLEDVFAELDPVPLAAASIAQVHAATLRSGESVVVKVQRPTVASLVRRDLAALSWLAPILIGRIPVAALANPPALVELFGETISEELDFRLEADNMLDVAAVLAASEPEPVSQPRPGSEPGTMRGPGDEGEVANGAVPGPVRRPVIVPRPHPHLVTRRVLVMERLHGFGWDDVAGMRAAGIDTEAVVRTLMIAFLEGAALHGVFHGDLHGGNLLVQAGGTVSLLDYGITGRLDQNRRLAFLRLLLGGTTNDPRVQLAALRDLGALPRDTDLEAVLADLGLDQPPADPTTMSPDELLSQLRQVTKQLLGYGARFPKVLMLVVKDLLFLDGALATLAPDVDLLAEVASIAGWFATHHGARIAAEVGIDPRHQPLDPDGVRAAIGIPDELDRLTYRDLQARRALIRSRMDEHRRSGSRSRIRSGSSSRAGRRSRGRRSANTRR